MLFELKYPNNNLDLNPEFYFLLPSDVTLTEDSPYVPMPILDVIKNSQEQFKTLVVKPDLQVGFYVIKIPSSKIKEPFKITITVNGRKNL